MRRLVVFGVGEFAEVAEYYFSNHDDYEVVAFTVDKNYVADTSFLMRPVVPFEEINSVWPADEADMFIAVGYTQLNSVRASRFLAAQTMGYRLASFVSERAFVWRGFELKQNCFILDDNILQPYSRVEDDVVLWSGNHIGHHSSVSAHSYIAGYVVVAGNVRIGEHCFVGSGSIIRDHLTVGSRSVIGMGTLLLEDAPPDSIYAAKGARRSKVPSSRLRRI